MRTADSAFNSITEVNNPEMREVLIFNTWQSLWSDLGLHFLASTNLKKVCDELLFVRLVLFNAMIVKGR